MQRARPAVPLLLLLLLLAGPLPGGTAPRDLGDECQQQLPLARSVASWIVGGHEAPEGAWPWVVSLQVLRGGVRFVHLCGGVLLSRRAVLTAGHCVDGRTDPCSWRAVLGVHNLQKHSPYTAKRRIRRIIVHSEFKRETFENDVAVFELKSAVRHSLYVQPMCLPPAALVLPLENSSDCYISGWGRTAEKGKISSVLKEAQVEILPPSLCNSSEGYAGLMDNRVLCAGAWAGGTDACQGDSGGPLVCYHPDTDKYYLIGIASFGVGCGRPKYPGIYVRLSQYRKWIKAKLRLTNTSRNPVSTTLTILLTVAHTVLAQTL
ncbi:transmembrane protease serine 12 [Corvus kubaryi]|uniref:transmembrane protease serine 12 n=1 Tax=Corvus kubaryi TaxID=68294 RepID=UPI001C052017|nr:transmembrane protease serine 12 [Corvus kubaryi]